MRLLWIALAATALWGQESSLSVGFGQLQVRFLSKVEPPGQNARAQLPGGVFIDQGRVHHTISDPANKRQFGYDLLLEPGEDGNTVQLRIEPMKLSNPRVFSPLPGWTLIELPKYPVIPRVKVGDTVALDLLVNPATGQKIVDYLTVVRNTEGAAHDFTLADVELTLNEPQIRVNGKLVEAAANSRGGVSGVVVWFYTAEYGRFILSLFPNEKLGFQKNGVAAGDTLTLREGSTEYRLECDHAVAPGSGRYNLYVVHEPAWRPGGAGEPFMLGSADKAEWVVGKH
jgi:hypothetical protein